jgi:hypothetical protein
VFFLFVFFSSAVLLLLLVDSPAAALYYYFRCAAASFYYSPPLKTTFNLQSWTLKKSAEHSATLDAVATETNASTHTRKVNLSPTHHVDFALTFKKKVSASSAIAVVLNTVTKMIVLIQTGIRFQLLARNAVTVPATETHPAKNSTKSATTTWRDVAATVKTVAVNTLEMLNRLQ